MNSPLNHEGVYAHAQVSHLHYPPCVVCGAVSVVHGSSAPPSADAAKVDFLQRYRVLADAAGTSDAAYHFAPLCWDCQGLIAQSQEFERHLQFNVRTLKDKRRFMLGVGTGEFESTGTGAAEDHQQVYHVNVVSMACDAALDDRSPPSHPGTEASDHSYESHPDDFNMAFRNYGDDIRVSPYEAEADVYSHRDPVPSESGCSSFNHSPEAGSGAGDNAADMVPNAETKGYVFEQVDGGSSVYTPSPMGNGDEFYSHVEAGEDYKDSKALSSDCYLPPVISPFPKEPGNNKRRLAEDEHETPAVGHEEKQPKPQQPTSKAKRRRSNPTAAERSDAGPDTSVNKCDNCGKLYASKASLRNHLKGKVCQNVNLNVNKMLPSVVCDGSGLEFFSQAHMNTVHENALKFEKTWPNRFPCEYCNEVLCDSLSLKHHLAAVHQIPPTTVVPPKAAGTRTVRRARSGSGVHTCHVCFRTISNKKWFLAHMMSEHSIRLPGLNIYPCDKCDKVFYVETSYKGHMDGHAGIRMHKCNLCDYTSNYSSNVINHKRKKHKNEGDHPSPGIKADDPSPEIKVDHPSPEINVDDEANASAESLEV